MKILTFFLMTTIGLCSIITFQNTSFFENYSDTAFGELQENRNLVMSEMENGKNEYTVISSQTQLLETTTESQGMDIVYTVKFVCGSVFGNEGPLRPGHYDTNISIINKKNFNITIFWNVVINDGEQSHSILKNLGIEKSTGIFCNNIRDLLEFDDTKLVDGFVLIRVPTTYDPANPSSTIIPNSANDINFLDVQVFYTANALDALPSERIYEKISFYIIQDYTGKIPESMIRKHLDVTLPSKLNEISNTELKLKDILAKQYDISEEEYDDLFIRVKDVSIGVSTFVDDHALSLRVVNPEVSPTN